ncbi:formyltetrahydrofolate deformylase, partial [Acinetobacter nosocomialis]
MAQDHIQHYVLKIRCPAASGIVAAITGYLAKNDCYIGE